jgi:hypothetical protein
MKQAFPPEGEIYPPILQLNFFRAGIDLRGLAAKPATRGEWQARSGATPQIPG